LSNQNELVSNISVTFESSPSPQSCAHCPLSLNREGREFSVNVGRAGAKWKRGSTSRSMARRFADGLSPSANASGEPMRLYANVDHPDRPTDQSRAVILTLPLQSCSCILSSYEICGHSSRL